MGRRVDGCRFRLNFNGHPSSAHRSPGMSARSWRLEAEAFNARASEAIRTAILEVPISDEETGISGRLIDFEDETAVAYGESKVADEGDIVPFEVGGGGAIRRKLQRRGAAHETTSLRVSWRAAGLNRGAACGGARLLHSSAIGRGCASREAGAALKQGSFALADQLHAERVTISDVRIEALTETRMTSNDSQIGIAMRCSAQSLMPTKSSTQESSPSRR